MAQKTGTDFVIYGLSQIFLPHDIGRPLRGGEMGQADILQNGAVAVRDGKIYWTGCGDVPDHLVDGHTDFFERKGCTLTPGLVDAHTHLVHAGSRENEFAAKLAGVPYLDILKAGGGILSTVNATREAGEDALYAQAKKSLDIMLAHGVTTVEAKSGYGLNWETERKQMIVARALNESHPADVVSTFMGAHAVPPEYRENPDAYVDMLINEMLPHVADEKLAEFCDVFCEEGVFTLAQTKRMLSAAKARGLGIKLHADEIVPLGGAELAAELGAVSADHLMAASDEGISRMARSGVIANLLPATTLSLGAFYAPARKMIAAGCALALSTDYNPGSCPCENLQLSMQIGSLSMKLTPVEVFNAVTVNGAYALGRGKTAGTLGIGRNADFVVFDAPNIDYVLYHFGINHAKEVYKNGKKVAVGGKTVV